MTKQSYNPIYIILIVLSLFLISNLICYHSSVNIFDQIFERELKGNKIIKENNFIVIELPDKNNYLMRMEGDYIGNLPVETKVILNKKKLLSDYPTQKHFKKEIVVESDAVNKGNNLLELQFNDVNSKVENIKINIKNYRGYNSGFPKMIVLFKNSKELLDKLLIIRNMFSPLLSLLLTYIFVLIIFFISFRIMCLLYNSIDLQSKSGFFCILPSVIISILTFISDKGFSYYFIWDLVDVLLLTFIPFVFVSVVIGHKSLMKKTIRLLEVICDKIILPYGRSSLNKINNLLKKINANKFSYYILFFILFIVFFVIGFPYTPRDMGETSSFDTDIKIVNYKNDNNLTLEQINGLWSSITSYVYHPYPLYQSIYSSPLYSLIRAYLLKLPLHPMTTFNLFNLLVAILFFYSSYLLFKLLFGNNIAIKTLVVMLSFYGVYTVTRFSGRGYIVIGLSFILFGCYFIWKSFFTSKKYNLIFAGFFYGLSWTVGNHMSKLTPAFLLITTLFYVYNWFNKNGFSFRNLLYILLDILILIIVSFLTSIIIIKIIAHYFNIDPSFYTLLSNSEFRKVTPLKYALIFDIKELFRRFSILIFFARVEPRNHYDEFVYNQSLIPEIFMLFFIFSIFYIRKNYKASRFMYASIFAVIPFVLTFVLDANPPSYPSWAIRYYVMFLPFLALFVVFGINYYFDYLFLKIKNNDYRLVISTGMIFIIILSYFTRIYTVAFGDYAKSWNNCNTIAGHRGSADALKKAYKKYDKTIVLHNVLFNDFMIPYFDLDNNHKYNNLDAFCLNNSLPKLLDDYTKENGKVLIILQHDKRKSCYNKFIQYYPKIEMDLIEEIELPKARSLFGESLRLYLLKKI